MPFATTSRGTRLHYETFGTTGPHVVLIQGLGLSSKFWFDLPRLLAHDPERAYRVLTLDNRGTGRSDRPAPPYRMGTMADDVVCAMDAAHVRSAYVVGISLGGMIAQHVALRHPRRVDGLVLLATSAGMPHMHLPRPRMLASLVAAPFQGRRATSRALMHILLPKMHHARAKELLAKWPAALREHPTTIAAFFGQFAAAAAHSTGFSLRKIRCPTVVVTGADDGLIPRKNSELLARRIPGAMLEVIPNVGHGIPILDERVVHRSLERLIR